MQKMQSLDKGQAGCTGSQRALWDGWVGAWPHRESESMAGWVGTGPCVLEQGEHRLEIWKLESSADPRTHACFLQNVCFLILLKSQNG